MRFSFLLYTPCLIGGMLCCYKLKAHSDFTYTLSVPLKFLYTQNLFKKWIKNPPTFTKKNHDEGFLIKNNLKNPKKEEKEDVKSISLEQAIDHLHNKQFALATKILLKLLEKDSSPKTSLFKRRIIYNLALSYFWQDNVGEAIAHLRSLLFVNPYNSLVRKSLQKMGDPLMDDFFSFWIWIPPEPVGLILSLIFMVQLIFLIKKRYTLLMVFFVPNLFLYSLGFWYFYKRWLPYATVTKESSCLSFPKKGAPKIFDIQTASLVQILLKTKDDSNEKWVQVRLNSRQAGWVLMKEVQPLYPK